MIFLKTKLAYEDQTDYQLFDRAASHCGDSLVADLLPGKPTVTYALCVALLMATW